MDDELKKELAVTKIDGQVKKKKEKKQRANINTKTQQNATIPNAQLIYEPSYWHMTGDRHQSVTEKEKQRDQESKSKIRIRLQDVKDAHNRIKNDVVMTPIVRSKYIAKDMMNLYFKCENLQHTGSFKARGACNVIACLSPEDKSKGCIISGARNFLHAMTYYGRQMSVPVNVVVPKDTPITDRQTYKDNYAILKMYGSDVNEANIHALCYCDQIGAKYIHGSDRIDLIAGYGTIGLEVIAQLDKIDCVICPVGSGGLAAGVIIAIKSIRPNCLVYGVECSSSPAITRALQDKKPQMVEKKPTIADSLQAVIASNNAFHVIRGYIDRMITVDETNISRAMIALIEREKLLVEGAGACAVAAILANKTPELHGKRVVCILTGANVVASRMSRVIDRGLASEGRLVKLNVTLPDAPGALAKLLAKVCELGVDVRSLLPERTWMKRDIYTISVNMVVETCNKQQSRDMEQTLLKYYPQSHFVML